MGKSVFALWLLCQVTAVCLADDLVPATGRSPQTAPLLRRCELRIADGDITGGLADCGTAILGEPRNPDLYVFRGYQLWTLKRQEEALSDFDRALSLDAGHCDARALRAVTEFNLGYVREADKDSDAALDCNQKSALAWCSRGLVDTFFGRFHRAIRDFTQAIALKPSYAEAYEKRALAFRGLGNARRAEEDSRTASQLKAHVAGHE